MYNSRCIMWFLRIVWMLTWYRVYLYLTYLLLLCEIIDVILKRSEDSSNMSSPISSHLLSTDVGFYSRSHLLVLVTVRWIVRCLQVISSFRCRCWGPKQTLVKSKRLPWLVTPHKMSLCANYCQSPGLLVWFLSEARFLVLEFKDLMSKQ